MNLQEWRAKQAEGKFVTIPSGLEVRLRHYGLIDLVLDGKIPSDLEESVNGMLESGVEVTMTTLPEINRVMNILLDECIIGPEGLTAEELPANDRQWLFRFVAKDTPAEEDGSLESPSNGLDVQSETVNSGGIEVGPFVSTNGPDDLPVRETD